MKVAHQKKKPTHEFTRLCVRRLFRNLRKGYLMRKQTTTETEARASLLDTTDLSERAVALHDASRELLSAVELTASHVLDALERGDGEDRFIISAATQRRLYYLIGEAETRAAHLESMAENESVFWLNFHEPESIGTTKQPQELAEVIDGWRAAHAKWRDRLDLGDEGDGPESSNEETAAEALLRFQCHSHEDVQQKLSLFTEVDHLGSLGADRREVFFPSLIIPEGGAV